jgi:hypothetical protein
MQSVLNGEIPECTGTIVINPRDFLRQRYYDDLLKACGSLNWRFDRTTLVPSAVDIDYKSISCFRFSTGSTSQAHKGRDCYSCKYIY